MDSLYSTANSTFLATACGKCILLLGRWLGQSEEVDHTIQIFRDNLRLLRDVLEAFDRSEKKEFDEIAVSTNLRDPNFLWSQLKHVRIVAAIVLGRLDDVLVSFCPADLGDLEKLGHQFKKSIDSGDLAVLRQRVVLLSGALNLPLQMMSFHTQTENAVRDEAVVEQLSMKINDIQTSIRTLHSQIENVHETDYLNQDLGLPLDVVNLAGLADELSTCASLQRLGIYKPMPIASSGKYMRQKKSSIHYWELYERQKILFCFLQNIVSPGWH
ncbi:hypothetical protein BDZ45DRAFT_140136 [Acephala macrosclerotiorum]|nr:hypothetical protein BDZ45DRAFT_140136 [Acephala macrosclerotiorum]